MFSWELLFKPSFVSSVFLGAIGIIISLNHDTGTAFYVVVVALAGLGGYSLRQLLPPKSKSNGDQSEK